MEEKYLPIGTVVLLKGGTSKAMITGYCAVTDAKKGKIFDYRGCAFPDGILESRGVALFDHDQIKEICHMGYKNEESIKFLNTLKEITKS